MVTVKSTVFKRTNSASIAAAHPVMIAILVAGDCVIFALFVAIGRANHKESQSLIDLVNTAAPFVLAWFAISPWFGAFGRRGGDMTTRTRTLIRRASIAWAIACPAGLLLRALVWHQGVPVSFDVITLVFNGVLLVGWRGVASWIANRH